MGKPCILSDYRRISSRNHQSEAMLGPRLFRLSTRPQQAFVNRLEDKPRTSRTVKVAFLAGNGANRLTINQWVGRKEA